MSLTTVTQSLTRTVQREPSAAPLPRRLDSLTGLRFFAALAVFAHHFTGTGGDTGLGRAPALFPYSMAGGHGVTFFFVLSGFLLTWVARPSQPVGAFYWRRLGRILPAHLVALVPAVCVFYVLGHQPWDATGLLSSVFLLQPWFPHLDPALPGNPVTWTLGVELFFYALFPLLLRGALRLRTRVLAGITALGLAGMWAVNWWAHVSFSTDTEGWVMRHPLVYLPEFALGMVCALAIRRGRRFAVHPALPVCLLALVTFLYYRGREVLAPAVVAQTDYLARPVMAVLAALVVVAFVHREVSGRTTLVAGRGLVALGTWSYCFYLVHQSVIDLAEHLWGRMPPGNGALGVLLGTAVLATVPAWALWRWVEEPAARWWNGRMPRALRDRATARSGTARSGKAPATAAAGGHPDR
ncbi:acyltransferase family protein [Streptomyces sp. NPDC059740]|uniref:acyltransferase family protein n=1 Tax=Streptomyces sp. NPDC059740 TaxID=3346926 RepID=UPI003647A0D4